MIHNVYFNYPRTSLHDKRRQWASSNSIPLKQHAPHLAVTEKECLVPELR
ncbi:hypothetical protein Q31b_17920 [Novipirellula aureliae]|uniref:Uncharacterized protein n=1 Tax=Novipirellula aureliae TaxID=2527966 RepID=A0A5C6E9U4_9BACT|nr:hypothetical protein Q31b_17920 [Novipirellula aureliae]